MYHFFHFLQQKRAKLPFHRWLITAIAWQSLKGASMARVNELVEVHSVRDFPQAKLDSQINACFLLNKHRKVPFAYNMSTSLTKWYKMLPKGRRM